MVCACSSSNSKTRINGVSGKDYHEVFGVLTDCIVHDIFSPPVAARIYSYPNLAALYILSDGENKILSNINGFDKNQGWSIGADVDLGVAAINAFVEVSKEFIFTDTRLLEYQKRFKTEFRQESYRSSYALSDSVAKLILDYASKDKYQETRTHPKINIRSKPGKWMPTPPDYMDAIEPHWNRIRPFYLDSANQFIPEIPPAFSTDKESDFNKELEDVYDITNKLNEEQIEVAKFWDCNPYVALHQGHYMEGVKKITPGGHWMGITGQSIKKANKDLEQTSFAYTLLATSVHDAFVSCWDEKYRSLLIRPETAINLYIDPDWTPILTTPPFPEYTSGHSVVSGTSSVVLTKLFGDDFSFIDSTELKYGLPVRQFSSFEAAAEEAAISRLYGGIHYISAIDNGLSQGRKIGDFISSKLELK